MKEREARQLAKKYGMEQIFDSYKSKKGFIYKGINNGKEVKYQVRYNGDVVEIQNGKITIL